MPRPRFLLLTALLLLTPALRAEQLSVVPDLYSGAPPTGAADAAAGADLVEQAARAANAGRLSESLQLATSAIASDPDNEVARRVLGYELHDGRWLTPYQAQQVGRGFVWHNRFGWLKQDEIARYEGGEHRLGRRWLSAEEDAARHATIDDGWQVRTDHFQVTTNHSLEAGAAIAAELESLFQVWRQLFAGYYLGEAEVRARFAGTRSARQRSRPFNVVLHRDKEGYVAALRHKQPRIAETLGIYFDDLREAHFYADGEVDRRTLYHEAVHQLFKESVRSRKEVGLDHGFWLVEGIACCFESLTPLGQGRFAFGEPDAGRLPAARHRRLVDDFYVPLAELAPLGKLDLQRRPDLAPLYSQSAGLAAYLLQADERSMREPLVAHLRALYESDAGPDDLFERLGRTPDELDAGYAAWLKSLPQ